MDNPPTVLDLAHAVICADNFEEAEKVFAMLCAENLYAARHLAAVLVAAIPNTAAMWNAIIEQASGGQADGSSGQADGSGVVRAAGAWVWAACDAGDTAHGIAARLGWRDMEART